MGLLPLSDLGKLLLPLSIKVTCDVKVWHLGYNTIGGRGEATTAAAAVMVPQATGSDASCQGPRPVVIYDHGTKARRSFDISALADPANGEGLLMAAVFAAAGYIVVAPDYAGYDTSSLGYHPYLVADQQAADGVDALAAARASTGPLGATLDSRLFVTGYSQGGFVALATHRALEAQGTTVTASGPMSGPYALAAFGDAIFYGEVNGSAVTNVVLLTSAYQQAYGNLWSAPTDVFDPAYAPHVEGLLPASTSVGDLQTQGLLPMALFDSTPPSPAWAAQTPATQPAKLAAAFALGFGAQHLITNAYRLKYLEDAQAHPDGGFPDTTNDEPAAAPANTLRQDLARNDLRNFAPRAPVLLCAGDNDPVVFYLNTRLMQGYWAQHAPGVPATVLDIDSAAGSGDPYGDYKAAFAAAKAAELLSGGDTAVLEAYHTTLVPPFCLAAVRRFFDAH